MHSHFKLPYTVHRQKQKIEVAEKPPYAGQIRQYQLGAAFPLYLWVVGALDGDAEEDRSEENGKVEDEVGGHGTADTPFYTFINGKDAVEEEKKSQLDR